MITTLRNNKNLLRGRKGFFKRELTYREIREFYKESTKAIARKEVDQKFLSDIRRRLIQKQKKDTIRNIIYTGIILTVLSIPFYYVVQHRVVYPSPSVKELKNVEIIPTKYSRENLTNEKIILGLKNMNEGNYFLAMGNFQNVLENYPDSIDIELLYAETVCLLCEQKKAFCPKAIDVISHLKSKYPKNYTLGYLEKTYLKKK